MDGVVTVVENNGQFQVVIGNAVASVYQEFEGLLGEENQQSSDEDSEKGTIINRVLQRCRRLCTIYLCPSGCRYITRYINYCENVVFIYLRRLAHMKYLTLFHGHHLHFTNIYCDYCSKTFQSEYLYRSLLCCTQPDLAGIVERIGSGHTFTFIGIPSETSYTSSVLPPLLLVWVLSYVEKYLNKYIHEVIRPLFVPFFSIVIMVPLTLLIIGPLASGLRHGIAQGFNWLVAVAPWLAGLLIAFWHLLSLVFISITPMVLANFEQYKSDAFKPFKQLLLLLNLVQLWVYSSKREIRI